MRCLRTKWFGAALIAAALCGAFGMRQSAADDSRYGVFGLLDSRSMYGKGVFPEPFLVDDSDLETNEFRLDWLHQQGKGQQTNGMRVELEKGFGPVTVELEVPYEYDT